MARGPRGVEWGGMLLRRNSKASARVSRPIRRRNYLISEQVENPDESAIGHDCSSLMRKPVAVRTKKVHRRLHDARRAERRAVRSPPVASSLIHTPPPVAQPPHAATVCRLSPPPPPPPSTPPPPPRPTPHP